MLSGVREKLLGSDLTPAAVPIRADAPDAQRQELRERLASFFRQDPVKPAMPSPVGGSVDQFQAFNVGSGERSTFNEEIQDERPTSNVQLPTSKQKATDVAHAVSSVRSSTFAFHSPTQAIQLHNSYLVAQSDDGMIIIDQHALHERIMYEELLVRVTRGPLESQRMLIPHIVPANSRQIALLEPITGNAGKAGHRSRPVRA